MIRVCGEVLGCSQGDSRRVRYRSLTHDRGADVLYYALPPRRHVATPSGRRIVAAYHGRMSSDVLPEPGHVPVLAQQVLSMLRPRSGQVCLDCTVGRGGHASLIAPHLAPGGRYIGLDADAVNVAYCRHRLARSGPSDVAVELVHRNFAVARDVLDEAGVQHADLMLADIGFASNQMADPLRGLSFSHDGPLDMRLDRTVGQTAADLVNRLEERELAKLISQYGQEPRSRIIARKIVACRAVSPIKTTLALAQIVREVYGGRGGRISRTGRPETRGARRRIDAATRTFMALRIEVNGELEALRHLLMAMPSLLRSGAVGAIISFHSLEDRLVKTAFNQWRREGRAQVLTRRPLVADDAERQVNPRSRSAKLRAIRWTPL